MNVYSKKMTRKENERLKKREEIMQVASRLFAQKGYHRTKMSDIAKSMDISVGYLYEHFKGKEELYVEIFLEKMEMFKEVLQDSFEGGSSFEKLEKFVSNYLHFIQREKNFFRLYMQEHFTLGRKRGVLLKEKLMPGFREIFKDLSTMIEKGMKKNEIKKGNASITASIILGSLHFSVYFWVNGIINVSLEDLKKEILKSLEGALEK